MPIATLELTDFTAFRKARLELSSGINVFVGENATGKTHALKALHVLANAARGEGRRGYFADKLAGYFRPDDGALGRLGHRRPGQRSAILQVTDVGGASLRATIATKSSRCTVAATGTWAGPRSLLFLPSREGLASSEGFIAAYLNRELAFDESYYDLAVALSASALKGAVPKVFRALVASLEETLGGKVVHEGGRFYVMSPSKAKLEAPLLSEGMRKVATVLRLLQNGSLRERGLLCWDEPEANLNPKLTVLVAEMLATLARNGVQVAIATHDYLLTETIALLQREPGGPVVRYFAFVRRGEAVEVLGADNLASLPANPIRAEYLAHYDRMRAAE